MNDDSGFERSFDEPSPEDFAAAEEEVRRARPKPLVRLLRLVAVLVLVVALLFYFAVPITVFVSRVTRSWSRQNEHIRPAPLAPEPTSTPKARV